MNNVDIDGIFFFFSPRSNVKRMMIVDNQYSFVEDKGTNIKKQLTLALRVLSKRYLEVEKHLCFCLIKFDKVRHEALMRMLRAVSVRG